MSDDPDIQRAVRRTVGIAAMKQMHRLIDAEKQQEARDHRFAIWFGGVCAVAAIAVVAWIAFR
jgi:hypothetical protein